MESTTDVNFNDEEIDKLMSLNEGDKLIHNEIEFTFDKYDFSQIPTNDSNTNGMISRPIWTDEEYKQIRFKLTQIKVLEIDQLQQLKDFKLNG